MSNIFVVTHGARAELTSIHTPISSTVSTGAPTDRLVTNTGNKLAVAAASSIAFVTTAASTQPNGQQTKATKPTTYFCATPAIGRSMKNERNIGLSAHPAVSSTSPISLTTYWTPHDSQPKSQSNA